MDRGLFRWEARKATALFLGSWALTRTFPRVRSMGRALPARRVCSSRVAAGPSRLRRLETTRVSSFFRLTPMATSP